MAGKSFEALWKHFVPRDGPPRNVQGEVLRAVARTSHELCINECVNWDAQFDAQLALIGSHLAESGLLDDAALGALRGDLEIIRRCAGSKQPPGGDARDAVTRVREVVVAWCNQRLAAQSREA